MAFVSLKQALDLSPEEQSRLGGYAETIKDVAEFFNDAFEALGDSPVLESLEKALPWVADAADSSGLPFIKFAGSFLAKLLKQKDPEVLGRLACTVGYQRAVAQAVKRIGEPERRLDRPSIKKELRDFSPSSVVDFKTLSLSNALSHAFIQEADRALVYYAERAGYSETQRTKLQTEAHRYFVENLRLVLTDGETADKFQPFRRLISLGTTEQSPFDALENHQEYQRRLFEEARIFNTEPFALKHVYVDTDCTALKWGDVSSGREDPFDPNLPRRPLLPTVMEMIADRALDDAIVIQGAAGAGKTSFSLRLCRELADRGFRPIRIRLRDVPLDMNIAEALPRAVLLHDPDRSLSERGSQSQDDLFLSGNLFRESIVHNGFLICPWVLILDGWDEISLSAAEGFRLQVTRMLRELRDEYLENRHPMIRVVITGRPSVDVAESHFLLQSTPVLTIRTLQPAQLNFLIDHLVDAIEKAPLGGPSAEATVFANKQALSKIKSEYEKCFAQREQISGSMEIFSLPLLAHLAMRLVAVVPTPVYELLKNSTNLYRNLVDEIVWRRGRMGEGASALVDRTGPDLGLRDRLRQTAAAITVFGKENIPSRELAIRLGFKLKDLEKWANDSTKNHYLTELLINFFFKGGNQKLGCEFLHKSFREYLFAEHILEILKVFGRSQLEAWPERRESEYWKDFPEKTGLWKLSRALGDCLSAQWMSLEVANHLRALVEWEIDRADHDFSSKSEGSDSRRPTEPLALEKWDLIRDGLADLWDWWGEGVHMRRPVGEDDRGPVFGHAYVEELAMNAAPRDPEAQQAEMMTVRTTTLDGHFGDSLFRLNVLVHFEIARKRGWLAREQCSPGEFAANLWEGASEPGAGPRRYQSSISQGTKKWILFAPSGLKEEYFSYYANRINGVGWRGLFPSGIPLLGVDFRQTVLDVGKDEVSFENCNLSNVELIAGRINASYTLGRRMRVGTRGHFFGRLRAQGCDFQEADLSQAMNRELHSDFESCNLKGTRFEFSDLGQAKFRNSPTPDARFWHADFEHAQFDDVSRPMPRTP